MNKRRVCLEITGNNLISVLRLIADYNAVSEFNSLSRVNLQKDHNGELQLHIEFDDRDSLVSEPKNK